MKILALDLATKTGWAFGDTDYGRVRSSGTESFAVKKFDGAGIRYMKFGNWLYKTVQALSPDAVYYEGVRRHLGVDAAHVYGGLLATMQSTLEELKVPYTALTVQEIKKLATGKGNAKKDAMIASAKERWPLIEIIDDNHADALWIFEAGCKSNPTPNALLLLRDILNDLI
jgi:Holliday junction resolvasome RuvABC endonuclease subunit